MAIRHVIRERLREIEEPRDFVAEMDRAAIAIETRAANEQHYEIEPAFLERVLGRQMKYSCCWWADGVRTLDEAEEAMLELTARRARLEDGQRVLELGCGWGSMALWAARRWPRMRWTAVSNSRAQKQYIEARAPANVEVITADMNTFEAPGTFDRIVSIEMFEHMRNWRALLERMRRWVEPDGMAFVHHFAHRRVAYPYEGDDWMARNFFTGGMMPSVDLLRRVGANVVEQHLVDGTHYAKTAEAWAGRTRAWKWRIFFLACAELFGCRSGREWLVCHSLLR